MRKRHVNGRDYEVKLFVKMHEYRYYRAYYRPNIYTKLTDFSLGFINV